MLLSNIFQVCSLCKRPGGSCIECRVSSCSVPFHPWCAHQKVYLLVLVLSKLIWTRLLIIFFKYYLFVHSKIAFVAESDDSLDTPLFTFSCQWSNLCFRMIEKFIYYTELFHFFLLY